MSNKKQLQKIFFICALIISTSTHAQFQIRQKVGLKALEGLDISKGSNYFLGWHNTECVVWDMRSGQEVIMIPNVSIAKFSSDGSSIYVYTTTGYIRQLDLSGRIIQQFSEKQLEVLRGPKYHFYPEQSSFIVDNKLYDISPGYTSSTNIASLKYDGQMRGQDHNLRKNILAVPDSIKRQINIVQLPGGKQVSLPLSIKPFNTVLDPFGEQVMAIGKDIIQVIRIQGGEVRLEIPTERSQHSPIFDNKGENIIYETYQNGIRSIVCKNISKGTVVWKRDAQVKVDPYNRSAASRYLKISPDGQTLIAADGSRGLYELFDTRNGATIKEYSLLDYHERPRTLGPIKEDKLPIIFNGNKMVLDLKNGMVSERTAHDAISEYIYPFYNITYLSPDKDYEFRQTPIPENDDIPCANLNSNTHVLSVRAIRTKQVTFTRRCDWTTLGVANTKNILAINDLSQLNILNFYNYTNGEKVFSIPFSTQLKGRNPMSYFSPDDAYVVIDHDNGILLFDTKNKKAYEAGQANDMEYSKFIGFTPDNKYALISTFSKIEFLELSSGIYNSSYRLQNVAGDAASITPDGRYMFYIKNDAVHLFDLSMKRNLAALYLFPDTNDWVLLLPSGLFDGNRGAQDNVYYTTSMSVAPLSTMFDKLYTPKLLPRLLNAEDFEKPDINLLKAIPTISIEYNEGTRNLIVENEFDKIVHTGKNTGIIKVKAECLSDKITEIRLYQNGKLTGTTRNLIVEDDAIQKSVTRTFNVTLSAGDNVFSAVAVNSQRSESKQVFINAKYKPEHNGQPDQVKPNGARLHLIVVGINTYKNAKYNLNYANADASSFKAAIETGAKEIFSAINTYYISDNAATKDGIQNALEKVKLNAQPDDLLVFYYAGHGVLDDKKEFYLVPYDVTQLYGNDQVLQQSAISSSMIQLYSKDIKAQKQLFILDACQSAGAFGNAVAMRGAAEEKAIAQLARSTGTHWLTASGSDQFASEFGQLGHGSFTYCLLEALKGKADNGDKKLTVKEIDAYLQSVVPEITKKYKGTAQYPASFGYGNDFPVIIIK